MTGKLCHFIPLLTLQHFDLTALSGQQRRPSRVHACSTMSFDGFEPANQFFVRRLPVLHFNFQTVRNLEAMETKLWKVYKNTLVKWRLRQLLELFVPVRVLCPFQPPLFPSEELPTTEAPALLSPQIVFLPI